MNLTIFISTMLLKFHKSVTYEHCEMILWKIKSQCHGHSTSEFQNKEFLKSAIIIFFFFNI